MVVDGIKHEMDEELFDQMAEALHNPKAPNNTPTNNPRIKPDGTYDKKPLDPNYFRKYYCPNEHLY